MEALVRYSWPGNVRELANVIERAQILAEDHLITLDDLPDNLLLGPPADGGAEDADTQNLHHLQRRHVLAVLREAKGNKVHAAKALGISRRALYRLLEKYQIKGDGVTAEAGDTTE
jgi:transcriptional regulator of acetoin/glycerol metabolism